MADYSLMPAEPDSHRDKRQRLDDKYAEIDKKINNDVRVTELIGNRSNLSHPHILLLLHVIREHSDGQISWIKTQDVFRDNTDLKDQLQVAWEEKSYRKILESDYFQSSSGSAQPTTSDPQETIQSEGFYEQRLREAWKAPFQGVYHRVLFDNINKMYRPFPYENICAIIQSSGTGKSRMVDEQAKLVYTLPINIRNDKRLVATYPPADRTLHEYLVESTPMNKDQCRAHYVIFFRCLFRRAAGELSTLDVPKNDVTNKWYEWMADARYRGKFYQDVVESCHKPQERRENACEELKGLISELKEQCETTDKIKVIIYIDEAHELNGKVENGTKLDILCSVISFLCKSPLFCLLLSTQSSLHFLAPTKEAAVSERAMQGRLLAPITETPFDCSPGLMVKAGVLRMKDLSKADYIAKWGRPLWWSTGANDDEASVEILLTLARLKLLCCHDVDARYRNMTRSALIAVLDVLLAFDFEPNHTRINDIQAEMVKSHMRIAYSMPGHRMYFQSGYPSEPLLAEAAAQQLWVFQKLENTNSFDIMMKILETTPLVDHSLIDLGQRGELAMRMFLMRAYMDGVRADLARPVSHSEITFSRGCKLVTFIRELFESDHTEKILGAIPDNKIDDTAFSKAFKNSMVRFTQFARAGGDYELTSEALCAAFARGVAFIGHQSQKYVDFAIPVLLDKKATLRESAMSAVLIQVKRHIKGSGPTTHTFTERDINLFPEDEDERLRKRPYIVLVAELGLEPEEGEVGKVNTPSVQVIQPPRQNHFEDTHPRYNIVACGGPGVYKYVTADQCAHLFATRDFSAEHARKDNASRNLVMKLKPIWNRGENTYHWYELPKPEV